MRRPLLPLLIFAMANLTATAALAGARDDVLAGIARCGTLSDDRQWLDCLYGSAQPMRAQLGLAPAPAAQIRLVPGSGIGMAAPPASPRAPVMAAAAPPPMPVRKSGGLLQDLAGGASVVPRMGLRSYSFDASNHFTIILADGQVWQQQSGDASMATWNQPASRYVATIRKGAFGSDNLEIAGDNRVYEVRRIR